MLKLGGLGDKTIKQFGMKIDKYVFIKGQFIITEKSKIMIYFVSLFDTWIRHTHVKYVAFNEAYHLE